MSVSWWSICPKPWLAIVLKPASQLNYRDLGRLYGHWLAGLFSRDWLFRGFVTEAFSLASWVVAFWVGLNFSRELSVYFEATVPMPSVRIALSFALLFLLTLVVGSLLRMILRQLVTSTGLTGSDRFLGLIFGIARGVLVVAILVLLAGLTPVSRRPMVE